MSRWATTLCFDGEPGEGETRRPWKYAENREPDEHGAWRASDACRDQRADLDNQRKVIYDGLEAVAFVNDRQVIADRGEMLPDDGRHARIRVTVVYFEGEE